MVGHLAGRLRDARERLDARARRARAGAPRVEAVYECVAQDGGATPESLRLAPGTVTTLRDGAGPRAAAPRRRPAAARCS